MKILPFTASNIDIIARQLRDNKAVILPTDTIYGIHLPYRDGNLARLNTIKQRPVDQPCNVIYAGLDQLQGHGLDINNLAFKSLYTLPGLTLPLKPPILDNSSSPLPNK